MDETNLQGKLEALLFLFGEPVSFNKLAGFLGIGQKEVREAVGELAESLKVEERGLHIVLSEDRAQITTKPALGTLLAKIAQEELDSNLTPASMETLAIIAYLGPCRRSLVEYVRGVNSSFILRSLMIRGLLARSPDPKKTNTFLYQVTMDFLRHIGVGSVKELPDYEKYKGFEELFVGGGDDDKREKQDRSGGQREEEREIIDNELDS